MKILVLGGRGYVGQSIVQQLLTNSDYTVITGSRSSTSSNDANIYKIDSTSAEDLTRFLPKFDIVVNCVAGTGHDIEHGAKELVNAALACENKPYLVHLSTQSVYGTQEGLIDESTPLKDDLGWYGHAKVKAEAEIERYIENGGEATILRPGCVNGPESPLWHTRFKNWLESGMIGDLGSEGDGWSNLVDVEDIAQAVQLACEKRLPALNVFNIAAPDAPRWNQYIIDLAVQRQIPVKRISARKLKFKVYALGIPMKVMEHLLKRLHIKIQWLSRALPPSLTKVFNQEIHLQSQASIEKLGVNYKPYKEMMKQL